MAAKAKTKRQQPKGQRSHIPALDPLQLEAALARLDAAPISVLGKEYIRRMLQAGANPNSESPGAVIATLQPEEQSNIGVTSGTVQALMTGIISRGGAKLLAMDDDEWERLVNEAANSEVNDGD